MGIQKLGHIMFKRFQAKAYGRQALVSSLWNSAFMKHHREGIAGTVIMICVLTPPCYGLMYWCDLHGIRTACKIIKEIEKLERQYKDEDKNNNVPRHA